MSRNGGKKRRVKRRNVRGFPARLPGRPVPGALGLPRGVRLQRPVVRLGENEVGYCMDPERTDDCLRPAVATALQVPVEQVPDPRLDQRLARGDDPEEIGRDTWVRLMEWLDRRGLQLSIHRDVPVARERWIGVCPGGVPTENQVALARLMGFQFRGNPFADHCLVMSHDEILFDPAISLRLPRGVRTRAWRPSQVAYGLTFDPIQREE